MEVVVEWSIRRRGCEEGRRDEGRQRSWEGDYVSRIPDNTMKYMALF